LNKELITSSFFSGFSVDGFNDYLETDREQLFGYNANCLIGNGFPVDIFFSTLAMERAPVLVTLSRAIGRPVLLLALFGAVSPLLAPATEVDR